MSSPAFTNPNQVSIEVYRALKGHETEPFVWLTNFPCEELELFRMTIVAHPEWWLEIRYKALEMGVPNRPTPPGFSLWGIRDKFNEIDVFKAIEAQRRLIKSAPIIPPPSDYVTTSPNANISDNGSIPIQPISPPSNTPSSDNVITPNPTGDDIPNLIFKKDTSQSSESGPTVDVKEVIKEFTKINPNMTILLNDIFLIDLYES